LSSLCGRGEASAEAEKATLGGMIPTDAFD
jgi:hypothetical protein